MKSKQIEFSPYDTAEFLRTPEEISDYLEAVFDNFGDDHRTIIKALGNVARARGMQKIADATGLQRQGLYKSLSAEGNPSFETVLKVMGAVGVELRPKPLPRRTGKTRSFRAASAQTVVEKVKVKSKTRFERNPVTGEAIAVRRTASRKHA
jgi:probable addiction module antidote protein